MPLPFVLLLPTTQPAAYEPAPWYVQFVKDFLAMMPAGIAFFLICVFLLGYLLRDKWKELAESLYDGITARLRHSSKQPVSASELARKGKKKVLRDQAAERARLAFKCEHISVYGCQNGVYLRSGDGIDKFLLLSEAAKPGLPRHEDSGEVMLMADDIPYLTQALEGQPFLLLWANRCDDWKINKLMSERGYSSSIAVYISRPMKAGVREQGVIGMFVLSWTDCEVYRQDQSTTLPQSHNGPVRLIDAALEELIQEYKHEFSYLV
jgi:hypothetical protein